VNDKAIGKVDIKSQIQPGARGPPQIINFSQGGTSNSRTIPVNGICTPKDARIEVEVVLP
jgi:hypothetical protein